MLKLLLSGEEPVSGLSFFVGLASLVIAFVAAEYWLRASRVPIRTEWTVDPENELASYVRWIIAIKDAVVGLAAVAAVLSALSQTTGH